VRFALELGARILHVGDAPASRPRGEERPTHGPGACGECGEERVRGASLCRRHLRGRLVFLLDGAGWPRLRLKDGRRPGPGIESWREALFELDDGRLVEVDRRLSRGGLGGEEEEG